MTTQEETAIIKVNPYIDESVKSLHDQACKLKGYALTLVITGDEQVKSATNDLSILSKLKKALEEKRKEYTGPINEHLKFVNDAFKIITVPLDEADKTTREKILAWRKEQDRRADEIAEINILRQEAAIREAKLSGTGEISQPIVVIETPAPVPKTVRTDSGMLATSKVWKWEIEDISKIPGDYLMVDAVRIGKVVRAGLHSIPGIRIWSEDTLKVSAK